MNRMRACGALCLLAATNAVVGGQSSGRPIAANVAGPVTVKSAESVTACLSNMGDSPINTVLQILTIATGGATRPVPAPQGRVDVSIRPGESVCHTFTAAEIPASFQLADGAVRVILVTHGVDANGETWATLGPNLLSAYEVVSEEGEVRLLVPSSQKVIQSNLLE